MSEVVSFRLPETVSREEVDRKAITTGCKDNTDLYQKALYLYMAFDPRFLRMVDDMARSLNLRTSVVIERLALTHLAEMAADDELAGGRIPRLLDEFTPGLDALRFFEYWKDNKIKQLKADEELGKQQAELNKFLKPGEKAATQEELGRRKSDAEIDALPLIDKQKSARKRVDDEDQRAHYHVEHSE